VDYAFGGARDAVQQAVAARPMRAQVRVRVVPREERDTAILAGLQINPHSRMRPGQDVAVVALAEAGPVEQPTVVAVWGFALDGDCLVGRSCMVAQAHRGGGIPRQLLSAALMAAAATQVRVVCDVFNRSGIRMIEGLGMRRTGVVALWRWPGQRGRKRQWPTR
jgi:GNAT superfamily N-acetyltransferase